jgi:hypothetical protein
MKTCKQESCTYPVFSHLYCKSHQYLRTDKKPKKIRARTNKKPFHKIEWGFTSQVDLFMILWDIAGKGGSEKIICPYTNERLDELHPDQAIKCFAHLLNKKNYPLFKLNPRNIRIVFPDFHSIVDQGTMQDKKAHPNWNFDLWDKEVFMMKKDYISFKKQNLLS